MSENLPLEISEKCLLGASMPPMPTPPSTSPIFPASVYICADTTQADEMLGGSRQGYVYQRDGHPNADLLSEKCRALHNAERAVITSSGMAALSVALLSQVQAGDHVLISSHLYGKTTVLYLKEGERLGIQTEEVDTTDLDAVKKKLRKNTKLFLVETISNPRLRVADIPALAELCHPYGTKLLVDNTFATPGICRPLDCGADFVMESMTKFMNGHGDLMLGLLCGKNESWGRVPLVTSAFGFASSPFDCWLAERGLSTFSVRIERASQNASEVAKFLASQKNVLGVDYPGLESHPDHAIGKRIFSWDSDGRQTPDCYGHMVTFHLEGGRDAADRFIRRAQQIPFCPSLGEYRTTLSHPVSTSHRAVPASQREAAGILGGTIRLSVGIESSKWIIEALRVGLEVC